MDKYTELEKQAQKFLDETDTMQFSTVELLTMFYNHQEQLRIGDVGSSKIIDLNNEEEKTNHNTNVVSEFMNHCKGEGLDIPDKMFETYFDA